MRSNRPKIPLWNSNTSVATCILLLSVSAFTIAQDLNLPSPSDSMGAVDLPMAGDSVFPPEVLSDPIAETDTGGAYLESGWVNPTNWFSGPVWEKRFELGINGSNGNAESLSLLTSGRLSRETDSSTWGLDVVYAKSESRSVLTQHYAFLNSRFDYRLGDGRWSLWNITRLEYDEFKMFDLRLAVNGGVGYDIICTDTRKLTGRFGAGASREFGAANDDWVPEAVFGADYTHKLSDRQRLSMTSDYYPAWADFEDYRLVTQASWELLIDEEANLSLKIGVLDRYDSTPEGALANDLDYFLTLLWKL